MPESILAGGFGGVGDESFGRLLEGEEASMVCGDGGAALELFFSLLGIGLLVQWTWICAIRVLLCIVSVLLVFYTQDEPYGCSVNRIWKGCLKKM
jgi:hypothetical protein